MSDIIGKIKHHLVPILDAKGLTLWDLEFKKDGPKWLLRLFIDREGSGVTLDDCESVSRDLSMVLDVEDAIPHAYTLEVSSPGLDRTLSRLEHYQKCLGKLIRIKTFQAIDGQKVFRGVLKDLQGTIVVLGTDSGTDLTLSMENIAKASLEVVL
ncbi:MAG: ribosome maturation factor RimP [Nitrospirota bacterium]|nr:ribosome maturation factor RimP [Nitrospirota bacterium]